MKLNRSQALSSIALLALAWSVGAAAQAQPAAAKKPDVRAEIARKLEVKPENVRPSAIPGLFEVADGTDIGYVSADGKYYLNGDVFDLDSRQNLTETRRESARAALIAAVPDSQAIVFSPANPKYTLTVFTDVDCGYCRKLHSEIAEINKRGIKVRYLLYPRPGPGSDSWRKAEAVWCSPNRSEALTRSKQGADVPFTPCATPIARHYKLGQEVGLRGTPALVTTKGQMIGGYMPADRLAEHVKELMEGKAP
ncbi:MAG: DsbC family protein [Steroidobacteraceae bacterium]|nr:DsbC family protein [Steroidobacteraceae bacterium]MCC7199475.1 DsbC family protein [Gammaproteobacteria bacterium]